MASIDNFTTLS